MKLTPKIAGVAMTVMALGGAGIGTAVASGASVRAPATHAAAHAARGEPTSPDTDAIQQGDQTSPDNATAAATRTVSVRSAQAHSSKAETPGEGTSAENAPSDGPGGNADASGNVQHEFNGVE